MLFIALHSHLSRILYITQKVCCSKSWSNCINITELVPKWSRVLSHPIALLVLFQSGTEGENLKLCLIYLGQNVKNFSSQQLIFFLPAMDNYQLLCFIVAEDKNIGRFFSKAQFTCLTYGSVNDFTDNWKVMDP